MVMNQRIFTIMGRSGNLMMLLDKLDERFGKYTVKQWINNAQF